MKSPLRVWLTVGPLALAAGGGALVAVLTSEHEENRILVSIFGLLVGWAFLVAGLIARTRRPENRTGILMLVVGFTFFVGALGAANNAVLYTIGIALGAVFIAALVHLLLAYPSGRLESQRERALVVVGYAAAFLANFVPMFVDRYPASEDCAECPENKLLVTDSPTADNVLTAIFNGLGFVVLALAIALLVRRWRRASPAARRLLGPVLIAGATTLLFFALTIIVFPLSETAANVIGVGFVAGFVATPFVFLWGILRTRLTRLDVSALLADSAETPTLVETQEALRDAIRDPTAELVYRLDDPPGYAKIGGERVRLDELAEDRAVMRIDADGEPLAAVVHDPALLDEPELLDRVASALRLRLEKDRSVRALRISESRSRALLDAIPDTMFRVARDGTVLDIHSHDPENVVIPPEEMIGTSLYDIPPEVIAREVLEERKVLVERAFESGEAQTQEYEINMPSGGRRFAETRIVPSGENEFVMIVRDVTSERLTESRSRALLEALPDAMFRLSRDGRFLDFHTPHPEVLAIPADEILEKTIYDVPTERIDADVIQERVALAERAFETGQVQTQEYEIRRPDGETMFSEARIVPAGDDEWVMIVRDVTDKRVMESRNEALLEALPDSVFRLTRDGIYLDFRARNAEHYLVETDSFVGTSIRDALPPAVAEGVMTAAQRAFETGEMQTVEGQMEHEGETVYAEARIVPSAENEFVMIVRDVTEQMHHEERIQSERDYFGALFDATPSFMCVVDHEGSMTSHSLNRSMIELTGYSDEDVAGRPFAEIFSAPENAAWVRTTIAAVAAGEDPGEQETHWQTRDGRKVLVAWTCTPLPEREAARRLVISGVDVTERRLREEEQAALRRVAVAVAGESRPEEIFQTVTEEVGRLLGADAASMVRFLPEGNEGLIVGYWQRGEAIQDDTPIGRMITLSGGGTSELAKSGHLIRYEDEKLPADWRERLRASGASSALTVPVLVTGRVWGTVMAMLNEGSLGPDAERRVAQFTNLVGTALANAEAREALLAALSVRKQREDEQAALRRVAVAIASEHRPEDVFRTVTEEVGRVLGANRSHMLRYDPQTEDAQIVGVWQDDDAEENLLGRRIAVDQGPYRMIRELGRPIRYEIDGADVPPVLRARLEAEGVTSVVVAPIMVSGDLWGAVSISVIEGSLASETEELVGPFTSLVATALANAEARQELLASRARIVEAGDAERRRLERNLHDGAQQRLVSLSLSLRLAQARLKSDVHAADEILRGASLELALALEELRELARGIHPAVLTDRGLGPALESLADRTPLPIAFDELPEDRLPAPIEAAAFYVVSEALANVAKYAEASSVTVRVAQEDGSAIVEVADDGVGGADPEAGSGLRGLSDRVAALEGRLAIVSPPGAGTRIRAEIPFG